METKKRPLEAEPPYDFMKKQGSQNQKDSVSDGYDFMKPPSSSSSSSSSTEPPPVGFLFPQKSSSSSSTEPRSFSLSFPTVSSMPPPFTYYDPHKFTCIQPNSATIQRVDKPLKLCFKAEEYSIPDFPPYPVTFLSITPEYEETSTSTLIDAIQVSLPGKVLMPDGIQSLATRFVQLYFKLTLAHDGNINVVIINDSNNFKGFSEYDKTDPNSYTVLAHNVNSYLFRALQNDPSLYYYIIHHILLTGQYYVKFDYTTKTSDVSAGQAWHSDKTDYFLLCFFKEVEVTCNFNETTIVTVSPRIEPIRVESYDLDNSILAKLTEIFKGEDCPVAFRFAIPNCHHVTQLLKDTITTHRAPYTGRVRQMFRLKLGIVIEDKISRLFGTREIITITVPISFNLDFFKLSREISLDDLNGPDGLFTFNGELLTGQIRIKDGQYTVKGGKTRRHKKNIKRKKRMTKKRKSLRRSLMRRRK